MSNNELREVILNEEGDRYDIYLNVEMYISKLLTEYSIYLSTDWACPDIEPDVVEEFLESKQITYHTNE